MPALLLPQPLLACAQRALVVALAGVEAVLLFGEPPREGRQPPPLAERLAERVAEAPPLTRAEAALVHSTGIEGVEDDETAAARIAEGVCWGDPEAAAAFVGWMAAQVRAVLRYHERQVRRVADALLRHETLSSAAVRLLLEEAR